MEKRVTIRDVARRLGIHHSTVSRALKNDRRISPATRELILEEAKRLGYRPDPMLSALMVYRAQNLNVHYKATLAWVTNYPTRDGWRQFEKIAYFRAARRCAESLGYHMDELWLNEPRMTARRATQILLARNIQGLLFIPQPRSRAHLRLDWSKFSAITFGHSLARPIIHNVDNNHFRSMAILMRQLKRLGYRRPGLAIMPQIHESNDRAWTSAFWAYQTLPPHRQVPLFMERAWTRANFRKWFLQHRPDVVICHVDGVLRWIEELGFRVPHDVGFALSAKHGEFDPRCSGIDENSEAVGEAAVRIVVQMIHRRETGIPLHPSSTLIDGTWVPGETVRKMYL